MKVAVLGDPGGLGGRIASEFGSSAMGLSEDVPADCDGVVIVVGTDPAPAGRDLTEVTGGQWRDAAEQAPWRALCALQRARDAVLSRNGHIVVITPTVGLVGAAGMTPYVTGIEAVRAMVKSAARQWAHERISVSQIAIPLGLLVTVPEPAPDMATVSPFPTANIALTFAAALIVSVQALVPEQLPCHPVKK